MKFNIAASTCCNSKTISVSTSKRPTICCYLQCYSTSHLAPSVYPEPSGAMPHSCANADTEIVQAVVGTLKISFEDYSQVLATARTHNVNSVQCIPVAPWDTNLRWGANAWTLNREAPVQSDSTPPQARSSPAVAPEDFKAHGQYPSE